MLRVMLQECDVGGIESHVKDPSSGRLPSALFTSSSQQGSSTFAAARRLSCGEAGPRPDIAPPRHHRRYLSTRNALELIGRSTRSHAPTSL